MPEPETRRKKFYRHTICDVCLLSLFTVIAAADETRNDDADAFVRVCRDDSTYFELTNDEPSIAEEQ